MPVLLKAVGVETPKTQLLYGAILNVISFVISTIGARFTDRLGRRPVLLIATSLFVIEWSIVTALTATYGNEGNANENGSRAAIAFIYLFGITYSFAYTPLQALYPVECLSFETRAKGMGMYNLFVNIAAFFNSYAIPVAWERVQWRFYYLYIAWNIFQAIFIYFFFVETKGRTLEEINEIFDAPYPKKKSLEGHIIVITEHGAAEKYFGLESHD
jgi:MFS family permease